MQISSVSSPSDSPHYVEYSQISQINNYCDFTPARITRQSDNPLLQEHCSIDVGLYDTVRRGRAVSQLQCFLSHAAEGERKLKGRYIDVEFAGSYPGCATSTYTGVEVSQENVDSGTCTSKGEEATAAATVTADPPANGTLSPLFLRRRTEPRRSAVRKRSVTKSELFASLSTESGFSSSISEEFEPNARDMDVESGPVTYHDRLGGANPTLFSCNADERQLQFRERSGASAAARRPHGGIGRGLVKPVPYQLPLADCEETFQDTPNSPPSTGSAAEVMIERAPHSQPPSWSDEEDTTQIDSQEDSTDESSIDEPHNTTDTVPSSNQHHILTRKSAQVITNLPHSPASRPINASRRNKPLPPPKTKSQNDIEVGLSTKDSLDHVVKATSTSSPDLCTSPTQQHRPRSVSFLDSSAGAELGRFPADYLGSRQVDSYIGYADSLAKGLINTKPVEVMVYVTSEKLRLAPPKNASLLFKSFAMKDILSVQRCSKNRRIVCVAVWKSKRVAPQCHALRCPSVLVSSALYDSILDQTQSIDDIVSGDKIPSPRPRALSTISSDSQSSSTDDHPPLPLSSPTATKPSPSPATNIPPSTNQHSPTEFLHKISSMHIGCAKAGRHDTVTDVIHRVLVERIPTSAKEVCVWLSLAQLRLIDMSDEQEMIYESHETSRIRAIGVYLEDKRFIGYIIKEEGKPLMGHVLRCNSAALMVSLVSFLRQACQIMFSQQGASLYDELSTDESDIESSTECQSSGNGLLKKLRCIANNHKPLGHTVSTPSFVSHTPSPPDTSHHHTPTTTTAPQSPITPLTPSKSPVSPLDFPEEEYSRFSITYIGSAIAKLPFSTSSLIDSLTAFKEGGVALGRAAVIKNVIQMHISAVGINLIDKKHRLFVNRNYPRKQLIGCCRHPKDDKVFGFASQRQGYPNEIKCHIFRQVQESSEHILQAIDHWLKLPPTSCTQEP